MFLGRLFFLSVLVLAGEKFSLPDHCISGQIRFTRYSKETVEKADYCFNSEKTFLVSKNCVSKKAQCIALMSKRNEIEDLVSEYGSPGFKLCYQVHGLPQIIEFYDGEAWVSTSRCFFKSDKSFINMDLLIKYRSQT